jgi:hypothetical protein
MAAITTTATIAEKAGRERHMNQLKIRIRNDLTGQDSTFESDRDNASLILDAKRILRESRQQSVFGLCLHIDTTTLTLHWYANDEKFARDICNVANIVNQATSELLEGKVSA